MSNFNQAENATNFTRALGNGATALRVMSEAFVHVSVSNNDATPIARLIDKAKLKNDASAVRAISFFVREVWDGAKISVEKGKPASVRLKGATFKPEALATLELAVANNVSLRSLKLKDLFAKAEGEAEEPKKPEEVAAAVAEAQEAATLEAAEVEAETAEAPATAEAAYATILATLDMGQRRALADMLNAHIAEVDAIERAVNNG